MTEGNKEMSGVLVLYGVGIVAITGVLAVVLVSLIKSSFRRKRVEPVRREVTRLSRQYHSDQHVCVLCDLENRVIHTGGCREVIHMGRKARDVCYWAEIQPLILVYHGFRPCACCMAGDMRLKRIWRSVGRDQ